MVYFALSLYRNDGADPTTALEGGDSDGKNSILSSYADGGFMPSAVAKSRIVSELSEEKMVRIGYGESPVDAITDCLKKCIFRLKEKNNTALAMYSNGEQLWWIPSDKQFSISEIPAASTEDAAIVCLELFRYRQIELVGIQ